MGAGPQRGAARPERTACGDGQSAQRGAKDADLRMDAQPAMPRHADRIIELIDQLQYPFHDCTVERTPMGRRE